MDGGTPRSHSMPFGAQCLEDAGVRFSLWAPAARTVSLRLQGADGVRDVAMAPQGNGRHQVVLHQAAAGTCYRYVVDGDVAVPDPASRFQPADVHGPSEVIDPRAFRWTDGEWRGRPWEEAVIYELHVGTFTPEGTFAAVREHLGYLADLGVSAIELMPVADFPGQRNWGYDGVLLYAPDSRYGRPEELKALVQDAHAHGLMVLLDVVYNHFGPDGNYLHLYAPAFFTERRHTPWGAAINFDGDDSRTVRDFYIHNALYWLEEYHLDGLRLDAVHAVIDESEPDILEEIAQAVAAGPGAQRQVHLVLENDHNAAHYLQRDAAGHPKAYTAQWNDDIHHALHVLVTADGDGYYGDYADDPLRHLGRCLSEGFAYQGEPSPYRGGAPRGEPTGGIPLSAFVSFLQNHDQVGNRALGERITELAAPQALRAITAVLLLSPQPPLLFMGQEWAAPQPFLFFCDFGPDLARAVTEGRRREFARFAEFADARARERIPDPNAPATFRASILDWSASGREPHRDWLRMHRTLLRIRHREIIPRLPARVPAGTRLRRLGARALAITWTLGDGCRFTLLANLGNEHADVGSLPRGRLLYPDGVDPGNLLPQGRLPGWTTIGTLEDT